MTGNKQGVFLGTRHPIITTQIAEISRACSSIIYVTKAISARDSNLLMFNVIYNVELKSIMWGLVVGGELSGGRIVRIPQRIKE